MKIQNLSNSPKVPFDLDGHILHSEKHIELIHLLLKPGDFGIITSLELIHFNPQHVGRFGLRSKYARRGNRNNEESFG